MDKSIAKVMPPMLNGKDLDNALRILPEYEENTCQKPVTERLMALQDLYSIYIPDPQTQYFILFLYNNSQLSSTIFHKIRIISLNFRGKNANSFKSHTKTMNCVIDYYYKNL